MIKFEHACYTDSGVVDVDITAPLYFWEDLSVYDYSITDIPYTLADHINDRDFKLDDFSHERLRLVSEDLLDDIVWRLNCWRELYLKCAVCLERNEWKDPSEAKVVRASQRDALCQIIQLLPASYNQKRIVRFDCRTLAVMCEDHNYCSVSDEWDALCEWAKQW